MMATTKVKVPTEPFPPFQVGDYACKGGRENLIGKGSFADVFKGENTKTGEQVAIKVVDVARLTRGNEKLKQHLVSEIEVMKGIDHPNIVKFYEQKANDMQVYMIFEFMAGGDFSKYLAKHKALSEVKTQYFIRQLASGLRLLRSKNIIHRDLKPQNLLLTSSDDNAILKIGDFGFARFIEPQSVADTLCGSPLYMAPEILKLQRYSVKTDLWSVGAILYETLTGSPPFPAKSQLELLQMLDKKIVFPAHIKVSPECLNLVQSLLQQDPAKRISWEEFFMHPWIGLHPDLTSYAMPVSSPQPIPGRNSPYSPMPEPISSSPYATTPMKKISPSEVARPRSGTYSGNSPSGQQKPIFPTDKTSGSPESLVSPRTSGSGRQRTGSQTGIPKTNPFKDGKALGAPTQAFYPSINKGNLDEPTSSEDEGKKFMEYELKSRRAVAIASLGDLKAQTDAPAEALVLYIKALTLLSTSIQNAKKLSISQMGESAIVLNRYREIYSQYLRKADIAKQYLKNGDTHIVAEKLIYDFALHLGREGAVQELLKNYQKSDQQYTNGILLLEQLYFDSTNDRDREILHNYVQSFSKRLSQTKLQLSSSSK